MYLLCIGYTGFRLFAEGYIDVMRVKKYECFTFRIYFLKRIIIYHWLYFADLF